MLNLDRYPGLARALFEESRIPQFLLNSSAEHVVDANRAAQRLTGFAIRELLRTPVQKLIRLPRRRGYQFPSMPTGVSLRPTRIRCHFRTFGSAIWLKAQLRFVWLPVQPHPLILMSVRPIKQPSRAVTQPPRERSQKLMPTTDAPIG
jgi:PAS domain-containing protein